MRFLMVVWGSFTSHWDSATSSMIAPHGAFFVANLLLSPFFSILAAIWISIGKWFSIVVHSGLGLYFSILVTMSGDAKPRLIIIFLSFLCHVGTLCSFSTSRAFFPIFRRCCLAF